MTERATVIVVASSTKIAPGRQWEFNDVMQHEFLPLARRHGMRLLVAWGNITGEQDVATHLWAYEDLAHLDGTRRSWAEDQACRKVAGKLDELSRRETTRVLTPLTSAGTDGFDRPARTSGLLMTARLPVQPAQVDALVELLETEFLPTAQRNGMRLVVALRTVIGPVSEILDLWRFDDFAAFGQVMRPLMDSRDFRRLMATLRVMVPDEEINLHVPLGYSPYR